MGGKASKGPELDPHMKKSITTGREVLQMTTKPHTSCKKTYHAADVALLDAVARLGCSTVAKKSEAKRMKGRREKTSTVGVTDGIFSECVHGVCSGGVCIHVWVFMR